ncbi:hypothetical protein FE257_006696 [Aspergillus nanangensis]|uniref:PNPLA domain-containing protein n=1 Tax=Aspergillus nanangensis TaxID=2582783 RepID=A0AAD4CP07_ASPNN|nr:hypothetical protein FE257_006696 [Aspergillus nanangensis]
MPVENYGIWKARVAGYSEKTAEDDRHLSLYCYDDPESEPDFKTSLQGYRNNRPGFFRAAINVESGKRHDSRLVYWVNRRFDQHPIINQLASLSFGFHPLGSGEVNEFGLDYIRDSIVDKESCRVVPHDIPGWANDILDILMPEIHRAIDGQADVYLFGSRSGEMIHNIHMNQGNFREFEVEDGVLQDGALIIHMGDSGQWIGIFLAFISQATNTDHIGHAQSPVTWGKTRTTGTVKCTSPPTVDPPGPAKDGVRLLSLDGGGIRGLWELVILEELMRSINPESPPNPCDVFDLICGSSGGGLIAIMLGRLRMGIDECIEAYIHFSKIVIQKPAAVWRIDFRGRFMPRYNGESFEKAIKEIIRSRAVNEDELLQEVNLSTPVTAVVAQRVVNSQIEVFSSHYSSQPVIDGYIRIWEAARATTAAPFFFDPVAIGPDQVKYIDGGMGASNPLN